MSLSINLSQYTFFTESKQYEELIGKLKNINYEKLSSTEKAELDAFLIKISKEVPKMIEDLQELYEKHIELQEIIKKQSRLENFVLDNLVNLSAQPQEKEAKIIQLNSKYNQKVLDEILSLSDHLYK